MPVEKTRTTHILLAVFHGIPRFVRKGMFLSIFFLFYHIGTKSRLITLHNLMRSFPEKDTKEIIKITKGVFTAICHSCAEFSLPYIQRQYP